MSHNLNVQARDEQDVRIRINVETVLFFVLLTITFGIRITNIRYNTLFVDEAIYATVGKNFLSGANQNAISWMYGSYLYPFISATANYLTGEIGLRTLSALMSSMAAVMIFQLTARLFNPVSGLWAMLLFGLTPISINLGQYAVYDAPVVPLLVVTGYCLIRAAEANGKQEYWYLAGAAISFVLATFSKYFAMLYLPALLLFGLVLYCSRGRRLWPLFTIFAGLTGIVLGVYGLVYWRDLQQLLAGNYGVRSGTQYSIISNIWMEIGIVALLAVVGGYWLIRAWAYRPSQHSLWLAVLLTSLTISFFAAPIYHVVTLNLHAAWKHSIYSLVFLAPIAGYGCATTIEMLRTRLRSHRWYRIATPVAIIIAMTLFLNYSLNRNWGFQHSWPNVTNEVAFLKAQGLTDQQHVLAEGAQIYEYYFNFDVPSRTTWQDTWYMEYGDLQGIPAMTAAIRDRWFNYVVLDDYYTPGVRQQLEPLLLSNGYTIGFEESEPLGSGGSILSRVYVRNK